MAAAPSDSDRLFLSIEPRLHTPFLFRSDDRGESWASLGTGLPDGAVTALVVDPRISDRVYAGLEGTGVFRTGDGGNTWTEISEGLGDFGIHTLEVDPVDPNVLYAGTEGGLYRSSERGEHWSLTGLGRATYAVSIAADASAVFAATDRGLFRSLDNGITWQKLTEGLGAVRSVKVHPADAKLVLRAADIVYLSRDGGDTWESTGIDGSIVAVHPSDASRLYAGSWRRGSLDPPELYFSTDGGLTWTHSDTKLYDDILTILVMSGNPESVFVGTAAKALYRSEDGGGTLAQVEGLPGLPVWSIALDPTRPSRMLLGARSDAGVYWSGDGGLTWSQRVDTVGFPTMSVDFSVTGERAYAGTIHGFHYSEDSGRSWTFLSPPGLFDPDRNVSPAARVLAVDPSDPLWLYAGAYGVFRSSDGGRRWSEKYVGLGSPVVHGLAVDPSSPKTIYAATAEGVFRSDNHADSWVHKSAELPDSPILAVAIDPDDPATLFVGTENGIYRSTDSAESWVPTGLEGRTVQSLAVDPKSFSRTVYAGTAAAGIFRSLDGGLNWEEWNEGLANPDVQALVVDGGNPSVVYAGTSAGLFRRSDGFALYFAQFGDGQSESTGIASEILLFNPDSDRAVAAGFALLDDDGAPLPEHSAGFGAGQLQDLELPPFGVTILRSDGIGELTTGSLTVFSPSSLGGTLLYSGGTGLAGVGAAHRFDRPFLAPVLNGEESRRTALAVMNLEEREVDLNLELRDVDGQAVAEASLDLPARGHLARFIDELEWSLEESVNFQINRLDGSIRVRPEGRVAAVVLLTAPAELATLPVTAESGDESVGGAEEVFFPQFADGGSGEEWISSRILVQNRSRDVARVAISFREPGGAPSGTDWSEEGSIRADIPPAGILELATDGEGPLQTGSVLVESDRPVAGLLLFEGSPGYAGILSAASSSAASIVPVENREGGAVRTGIALAGKGEDQTVVELILRGAVGTRVASAEVVLPPMGQISRYVDEFEWVPEGNPGETLDLLNFLGSVECRPSGPIAAIAIQTRPGQYATFPVSAIE